MASDLIYEGGKGLGQVRNMGQVPAEESARSKSLGLEQAWNGQGLDAKAGAGDAS